ncbi:MAG: GDP-mannose dehydrogenase [Acidobacteria bacterium]|nr:MAG: GDP-mannose dehydrogenase [Acidobacteriota bacterium]
MESISLFGLGYVGAVTAACLASRGHRIIGVDPNPLKVKRIASGNSPIVEPGVQEMIAKAHTDGLISATQDPAAAVAHSDISFISVGTPSQRNGKLDLSYIRNVCTDIGLALPRKNSLHRIVVRSTVLPGTTESVIVPAVEAASGMTAGRDFVVCFNPEFLREGTAVADFFNPPFTIVGTDDPEQTAPICELYRFLPARLYETALPAAEMIKYCCNAFHALKVAFANEIGTVCNSIGVDAKTVADIFKSDIRLNVSTAYLTPGFAFGGSCLPKDLRALTHRVRELDLKLPLLESILPSNSEHIERAAETILSLSKRKIGVLGLSFKPGTDDLRESPIVHLVKRLIAEGCDVQIWDDNVALGKLIGSNREFIESYIPHIGTLLRDDIRNVLGHADVVVLGTNSVAVEELRKGLHDDQHLIELNNLTSPLPKEAGVAAGA